jgi:hypothetical protein
MGIMICKTHGQIGFVETCSHIAKQIDDRKFPNGHHFTILGNFFICDDCFNSLGFEKFVSLAQLPLDEAVMVDDGRMEAFEAAYNAIEGRRQFCLKCVAELERQNSSV